MRKPALWKLLLAAGVIATLAVGAFSILTEVQAGPGAGCICPQVYAPVVCDNGKTYPNQCEADCHHAKNCVPAGIGAAE